MQHAFNSPDKYLLSDVDYAAYVNEVCAVGLRMRTELISRRVAVVADGTPPKTRIHDSAIQLRKRPQSFGSSPARAELGMFDHQIMDGKTWLHPNGFISSNRKIEIPVSALDKKRRWRYSPTVVAPKSAIRTAGRIVSWYDPVLMPAIGRYSLIAINSPAEAIARLAADREPEASRFVNSPNLVNAPDYGRMGHVWNYGPRSDLDPQPFGERIGNTSYYFESLSSYFSRVLVSEILIGENRLY